MAAAPVAFVGLGNMGSRMARNLLRAGRRVIVFDVNPDASLQLEREGARVADTPGAAAAALADQAESSALISMLPGNHAVTAAYRTGAGSIIDSAPPGLQLIDCSTVAPSVARDVAASAAVAGCGFIDAPVSGGVGGAEAASLTFMVGAESGVAVDRARPLLGLMGKSVVHCGGVGSGQAAKLSNNLVLAVSMIGLAEGMLLGQRLGVEKQVLASIFNSSSARCWASDTYNPCPGVMEGVPSAREYSGGFAVDLMRKDLGLALDAAHDTNTGIIAAKAALAAYDKASGTGMGDKDFSVIYRLLEEMGSAKQ